MIVAHLRVLSRALTGNSTPKRLLPVGLHGALLCFVGMRSHDRIGGAESSRLFHRAQPFLPSPLNWADINSTRFSSPAPVPGLARHRNLAGQDELP